VIPPSRSGINICLRQSKLREPARRWFTPHRGGLDGESIKFALFTQATLLVARASGVPVARPEYCPPDDAVRAARWLAERRAEGTPAVLDTQAALAVRVCLAARDAGVDISGTFCRTGGEPLTPGKKEAIAAAGCRSVSHYTMAETQRIGSACAEPEAGNDHHFLSDKLAVIQRPVPVGDQGDTVGALVYTALLPYAGKVMINVESGDYGELVERPCGCPLGQLGLTTHVNDIRSYNKLTAEGNHFMGNDLIELVDEALPRRFGGGPTDYQLVEEEVGGLPKVTVVVRPGVGQVDDSEVLEFVLGHLRSTKRNRLMAEVWRGGDTLRVVRREPHRTRPSGKILPLMVLTREQARS
jgi:phenylacetate-coenzyme A ligase PaaK-like adenylate-forming protein